MNDSMGRVSILSLFVPPPPVTYVAQNMVDTSMHTLSLLQLVRLPKTLPVVDILKKFAEHMETAEPDKSK